MGIERRQFSGGNFSYLRHPFSYFVGSMQRLGIGHIELYAASPHLYVYDYTPETVREIRKTLERAGIDVVCFTAEQCFYPVSLAIDDELVRRRSLDYYMRALELASAVHSPLMQIISGTGLIGSSRAEDQKRSAEGLSRLAYRAESLGVTLVLEADPACSVGNTDEQLAMISQIASPALSGMIDTNAVSLAGEDFEDCVVRLGSRLRHIHFIDITPNAGCLIPGTGTLPMKSYLEILSRHGYTGYLTPELWGGAYQDRAEDAMKKSFDFCYANII